MRVLSIDGGGYLGLASAAFLAELERQSGRSCYESFDLFCGTSTGALVAMALASGRSAQGVTELYKALGPKIFAEPGRVGRLIPKKFRGVVWGPEYENTGLRDALLQEFQELTLGDLRAKNKYALITAFNLSSGTPTVFKTDHAAEFSAHDRYRVRDVLLASTAAPKYFQIARIKDPVTGVYNRYCDGGLVSNSPAILGFAEAISHLGARPEAVSVLSVSTPREDLSERESEVGEGSHDERGYRQWGFGKKIIELSINGAMMINHQTMLRLARVTESAYDRVSFGHPPGLGLDVVTQQATTTLVQLGAEKARDGAVRERMQKYFTPR